MTARRNGVPFAQTDFASVLVREEWMDDAVCAQSDPEAFFPEKGSSTRNAKRLCGDCDVREQCLEFAMRREIRFGIWGGLSERERRALAQERVNGRPAQLTADVERVLGEMVAGEYTNVAIGEALRLSPNTVARYRRLLGLPAAPAGRRSA